ncbi:multidrug resistance-type transporter protein [Trichoderma austrokoningii]
MQIRIANYCCSTSGMTSRIRLRNATMHVEPRTICGTWNGCRAWIRLHDTALLLLYRSPGGFVLFIPFGSKMGEKPTGQQQEGETSLTSSTVSPSIAADPVDTRSTQDGFKGQAEKKPQIKDYFRVFGYATKIDIFAYAVGIISSIATGVTLPLMNVVFGSFVGNLSGFSQSSSDGDASRLKHQIDKLSLYMFFLFIARLVLNYSNKFTFRMASIRLSSAVRLHYLQRLFGQSVHVLDSMSPGYAINTITSTSNTLQLGISEKLGVFFEYNATIIAALVMAFHANWRLSFVVLSVVAFIILTVSILMPFIAKANGQMSKADANASSIASDALAGVRMIAACGAENRISQKYASFVDEMKRHGNKMTPLIALQFALTFFAVFGCFGLAFWFGTKFFREGHLNNFGTITVAAVRQFLNVIDAPQPNQGQLKSPEVNPKKDIILKQVTFAYPGRPHVRILDGLDLRIEAGKTTAIVGPSGSGKSTIIGLIEQWYSLHESTNSMPKQHGGAIKSSGTVSIGDHSLEEVDLKWWRSQIDLVQQDPFLFNGTIYTNVANGLIGTQWESSPDEQKRELITKACKEAFADEFINKFPMGIETPVGDGGTKLSGGQRQRIAIARAIVRQPHILIFDEATSAIDVRGEKIVQAALDQAARLRTTITIAHRLSTVQKADCIVVLRQGKVAETGTHESLLAIPGGIYSNLVYAQNISLGDETKEISMEKSSEEDVQTAITSQKDKSELSIQDVSNDSIQQNSRSFWKSFGRLLCESKDNHYLMILIFIFTACAGATGPVQALLFAHVIDVSKYTGSKLRTESEFWSGMFGVLAAGTGISYFGSLSTSLRNGLIIRSKYQKEYFESTLWQRMAFFDQEEHSQGAIVARVASDPQRLDELLGASMASVYIAVFSIVGSVSIAFAFGWKLAVVACCVVLPISIVASFFRFKYELQFERMNNEVFAESSKFASESIAAFRTVSAFTLEDTICRRFKTLCRDHVAAAFKKARWATFLVGLSDSAIIPCQALLLYYGGRLLANGELSILNFFVSFMVALNAGEAAGQSLSYGPNAAQVTTASNRILDMRESRFQDKEGVNENVPESDGGVRVELQDIHFKYPTRDVPVFEGLNLTIEKGQFAALVGASGCGKTSIISLLESVKAYRRHLSLVAQESSLFHDPSTVSDEQLHQTCRDASIHDFIVSLPEGFNTAVGSRGVSLSGGQKQRISIARALIRRPNILLLDEATSSLDPENERLIQEALERASKGRTMVVVAHKLSTVRNADVIFVFGDGKILEKGSHSELLERNGVYWKMCKSQALDA